MKRITQICLLTFSLVFISVFSVTAQIKSGPIVTTSVSWLEKGNIIENSYGAQYGEKDGVWKKQVSFQIGYQFIFPLKNNFAINTALLYQSRGLHVAYDETFDSKVNESKRLNAISLNGGINYYLLGKIPLGIGIEPTCYLNTSIAENLQSKTIFDVPFVLKAGYDFGPVEVILSYKQGSKSLYRDGIVPTTSSRDVQFSVFVPLFF